MKHFLLFIMKCEIKEYIKMKERKQRLGIFSQMLFS